jgi:hypothetical protein
MCKYLYIPIRVEQSNARARCTYESTTLDDCRDRWRCGGDCSRLPHGPLPSWPSIKQHPLPTAKSCPLKPMVEITAVNNLFTGMLKNRWPPMG